MAELNNDAHIQRFWLSEIWKNPSILKDVPEEILIKNPVLVMVAVEKDPGCVLGVSPKVRDAWIEAIVLNLKNKQG